MEKPYINAAVIELFLKDCAAIFSENYDDIEIPVVGEYESAIEAIVSRYFNESSGIPAEHIPTVKAMLIAIASTNTLPLSVNYGGVDVEAYEDVQQQLELEFWE